MKKNTVIFLLAAVLILVVCAVIQSARKETELANPASAFCLEQGGNLETVDLEKGQISFCVFEDGSRCEEWDLYIGSCDKGELKMEILKEGSGKKAEKGDTLKVHYVGMLEDGTKFDSSLDRNTPFSFPLGAGKVIDGWDQGMLGSQEGEIRKLTIASDLGYGETGQGSIPPNSTLVFEVEVLEIN